MSTIIQRPRLRSQAVIDVGILRVEVQRIPAQEFDFSYVLLPNDSGQMIRHIQSRLHFNKRFGVLTKVVLDIYIIKVGHLLQVHSF